MGHWYDVRPPTGPAAGSRQVAILFTDITARKHAEEAIRERDERLQLFLGNATDYAVIISDPDDRAVEWLGGAEQITGWRADEALGQPLEIIFTPEDRAAGVPRHETRTAAETGRAENTRWHQRKDGSRFFAEGVTVAIRGPAGEFRGFGKVFRDATAQKRAEDALARVRSGCGGWSTWTGSACSSGPCRRAGWSMPTTSSSGCSGTPARRSNPGR